jgi:rsbT co-antagonist protein RsbR
VPSTEDLQARITELEEAQRNAARLFQISHDLNTARDLSQVFQIIVRPAIENRASSAVLGAFYPGDSGMVQVIGSWQREGDEQLPVGISLPAAEFPFNHIWLNHPGETLLISDIAADERLDETTRRRALATGIQAAAAIPLARAGRWVGIILLGWKDGRGFAPHEKSFYETLPFLVTPIIENRQLVNHLERLVSERTQDLMTFLALVENAAEAVMTCDTDGRINYANPASYRLYGYDAEKRELLELSPEDLTPDDELPRLQQEVFAAAAFGGRWEGEIRQRRKDGHILTVYASVFNIYDDTGQPVVRATITRDITQRKQTEEALRESEERFRRIVEALPVGLHLYQLDDRERLIFLGANSAADQILGVDNSRYIGLPIEQAFPPLAQTEIPDRYRQAARDGLMWQTDQVMYEDETISGAYKVYVFQSAPGSAVVAFLDVTERMQTEQERERLQQQIIEAQRQALQELSTPIIPVMEGIIVMPLVGGIDTNRSRDLMRSLLEGISRYQAKVAILDITGVPLVDSGVAQHLDRTIQAARLKGTRTLITGVSEAVAETIVDLGIDWSGIETLSNLQTGLMVALWSLGLRIYREARKED